MSNATQSIAARLGRLEEQHRERTAQLTDADREAYERLLAAHPDAVAQAEAAHVDGRIRVALLDGRPGLPARVALAASARATGALLAALDRGLDEAGL